MLKVREIMTAEVVTLAPEMSLREAVQVLVEEGVSGAPVMSGTQVVGVVSTTDIVDFRATTPGVPGFRRDRTNWGEWGPAESWEDEVSGPGARYFVDMWGNPGADVLERMEESEGPEWDLLNEHTVGEIMTRKVVGLAADADLVQAARLMTDSGVHRVLVLSQNRELEGIVSSMDIVRAVAEQRAGL